MEVWHVQKSTSRLAGCRPREEMQLGAKGRLLAEVPHLGRPVFLLLRPSTDWLRTIYTISNNLIYSMLISSKNTFEKYLD